MTAPHSNPNPTLRRQIRNWFLTTLSALLLSASEAGLLAQFPAVTPGENGATPATRAGEIELARSQRAPHLEPEVKNRAEHDLQKNPGFSDGGAQFWRRPRVLAFDLAARSSARASLCAPNTTRLLLNNPDTLGDPHFGGNYLAEFSTFNDARGGAGVLQDCVLDLRIVKWAKKGY